MDAAGSLKPDFAKYNLVNNETGKVEEADLLYVVAKDKQNVLWSRGIKTALAKVA